MAPKGRGLTIQFCPRPLFARFGPPTACMTLPWCVGASKLAHEANSPQSTRRIHSHNPARQRRSLAANNPFDEVLCSIHSAPVMGECISHILFSKYCKHTYIYKNQCLFVYPPAALPAVSPCPTLREKNETRNILMQTGMPKGSPHLFHHQGFKNCLP